MFSMETGILTASSGEVAGISTVRNEGTYAETTTGKNIDFNITPEDVAPVWEESSINSLLLGYTPRIEGGYQGIEYWGDMYAPFMPYGRIGYDKKAKKFLGKWIRARVPLFTKFIDGTIQPMLNTLGQQVYRDAFIPEKNIQIIKTYDKMGQVLGITTDNTSSPASIPSPAPDLTTTTTDQTASYSASVDQSVNSNLFETISASKSSDLEIVSIVSTASATIGPKVLKFSSTPSKIAVVSSGMLNLLSIPLEKAMGTKFSASFIITKSLKTDLEGRGITDKIEYEIGGVVDDPKLTYFYIPILDMNKLGIQNYSQIKVVVSGKDSLPQVRKEIETLGFRTASTIDTVKQIENLFANLRILLAILGLVALGVASLGMFNTLTVSLLERTREIGGMKTMGMVSEEVQDLFLAEAMIMGLSGGIGGLSLGYVAGKGLSFLVSIIAISQGKGYLDLTYIPLNFTIFILITSFIVGVATGIYPAQRAKRISALNALRYE